MKQSKIMSFIESMINIVVGFGISCGAQALFLPLLGVPIPWDANIAFAVIMTVISLMRSFLLRRLFESLHIRRPLSPFMQAVISERFRQVDAEGYDAAHDDEHEPGELARAGAAYAISARSHVVEKRSSGLWQIATQVWPFQEPMKLYGFRRDLVKASALILAEGERFDRQRKRRPSPQPERAPAGRLLPEARA